MAAAPACPDAYGPGHVYLQGRAQIAPSTQRGEVLSLTVSEHDDRLSHARRCMQLHATPDWTKTFRKELSNGLDSVPVRVSVSRGLKGRVLEDKSSSRTSNYCEIHWVQWPNVRRCLSHRGAVSHAGSALFSLVQSRMGKPSRMHTRAAP
jgi:hypothetical protein